MRASRRHQDPQNPLIFTSVKARQEESTPSPRTARDSNSTSAHTTNQGTSLPEQSNRKALEDTERFGRASNQNGRNPGKNGQGFGNPHASGGGRDADVCQGHVTVMGPNGSNGSPADAGVYISQAERSRKAAIEAIIKK